MHGLAKWRTRLQARRRTADCPGCNAAYGIILGGLIFNSNGLL